MTTDIQQIKADIKEFEDFKDQLTKQQLTFPLDKKSVDVMRKDLVVPTGKTELEATNPDPVTSDAPEVNINDKRYFIQLAS